VKKSRVLLITDYMPAGGSRTYLAGVLEEMSKHGGTAIIFTKFKIDAVIRNKLDQVDCHIISLTKNRYASIPSRIRHVLAIFSKKSSLLTDYEIILIDFIFNLVALSPFSAFKKLPPIIYQLHGLDYKEKDSEITQLGSTSIFTKIKSVSRRSIEKKILNSVPLKVLVFSNYAQSLLVQEQINAKSKIIRPGLGFIEKATSKKTTKIDRNSLILSSRIDPRKGTTTFFTNIMPLISSDLLRNTDVIVMSNFYHNNHLDAFFESINEKICDNVLLLHNPSEAKRFQIMRAASMVILPSLDLETYGFSAQEALLSGIPVVAYNRCAYPEFIPKKMLVENEASFAKKIEDILKNPLIYMKIVAKAKLQLKKELSWSRYYNALCELT